MVKQSQRAAHYDILSHAKPQDLSQRLVHSYIKTKKMLT